MAEPIFGETDPGMLEIDCASKEPYERTVRVLIRTRYGGMDPITGLELPGSGGMRKLRREPSRDLLILERAVRFARARANQRGLTEHDRTLRHNEVDSLEQMRRYLLNAEAGEKYSMYDLFLCTDSLDSPLIAANISRRGRKAP